MSTDPFADPFSNAQQQQQRRQQQQQQQQQQQLQSPFGLNPSSYASPGMQQQQQKQPSHFQGVEQPQQQHQQHQPYTDVSGQLHQRHPAPVNRSDIFEQPAGAYSGAGHARAFAGPGQPTRNLASQQPPQQQQQQQQQQQSQGGRMWEQFAPNDPMLRFGMNQAQVAVQSGMATYLPFVNVFWGMLKYHFNVNNRYVLTKLRLLLFPFRHVAWGRERSHSNENDAPRFAPPVADINAPDLYIPTMAFVTYVLLVGLVKGTRMKFTPEVITDTFNATLLTQFVEVLFMKVGTYMLPSAAAVSIALTDLIVYSSYIYVGLVVDLLSGLIFGSTVYYAMLLYTAACMAWFMYFTMDHTVPHPGLNDAGRKRRLYFLVTCAAIQALSMWWPVYLTISPLGKMRVSATTRSPNVLHALNRMGYSRELLLVEDQ